MILAGPRVRNSARFFSALLIFVLLIGWHPVSRKVFALQDGESKNYTVAWQVSGDAAAGDYMVKAGLFNPGRGTLYHRKEEAATLLQHQTMRK